MKVAAARMKRRLWPLYWRTSFSKLLAPGDTCYIYAAGQSEGGRSIVGKAVIGSIEPWNGRDDWFEHDNLLVDEPAKVIRFEQAEAFEPLALWPFVNQLDLTRRTEHNWGAFMQGGCKRLTDHDVGIIEGELR
jgi:hypothetical protein